MLLLNNSDVEQVLTMDLTIKAVGDAYQQLFHGQATCRPRINIQIPTRDPDSHYNWSTTEGGSSTTGYFAIRLMSDVSYEREYEGVFTREKYCVRPGLFCGLVLLTDIHTGEPLALMNDGFLQHMRQGADGGIGAKHLSRGDSKVVGMLGSGGMARTHAEAYCEVRDIELIKVFSPTPEHRETYAKEMTTKLGIEVVPVDDPREVFRDADILSACTDSTKPVVVSEWLEEGTHIVDVAGLRGPATERVDKALRLGETPTPVGHPDWDAPGDSIVYRAGTPSDSQGERQIGAAVTNIQDERLIYFQDLLDGKAVGRQSDSEVTYSERGGMRGIQFAAVAGTVYERAKAAEIGHELPTEWFLQDIRN